MDRAEARARICDLLVKEHESFNPIHDTSFGVSYCVWCGAEARNPGGQNYTSMSDVEHEPDCAAVEILGLLDKIESGEI